MVNTEKTSGADSYLLYGVETTFGIAASTIDQHLGLVQTANVGKINRNIQFNRGLKGTTTGGQEVAKYTLGTADTGFSAEFNVFKDCPGNLHRLGIIGTNFSSIQL